MMKNNILILAAMAALTVVSCAKKEEGTLIGKPEVKVENGRFTPEVMWGLGKMGESTVSPDGKQLVYAATYYSMEENKGNAELYLMSRSQSGTATMPFTFDVWDVTGDDDPDFTINGRDVGWEAFSVITNTPVLLK